MRSLNYLNKYPANYLEKHFFFIYTTYKHENFLQINQKFVKNIVTEKYTKFPEIDVSSIIT